MNKPYACLLTTSNTVHKLFCSNDVCSHDACAILFILKTAFYNKHLTLKLNLIKHASESDVKCNCAFDAAMYFTATRAQHGVCHH